MSGIKKSEHRNATRSRRYIKQAFGELLNEKDLAKITVTDIVERANISRGTFYAHYLDVYDLYTAIQNNIMETLDFAVEKIGIESMIADPTFAVLSGMKFLEQNKTYYGLFANSGYGEAFVDRIINYIVNKFSPVVDELFHRNQTEKVKAFFLYTMGAYKNVILKWFSNDLGMSGADCADHLIEFYLNSRPAEIIALGERLKEKTENTEA